ncbi:hypothetical protein TraAM80_01503 [Trypanosoma rangeli]|uniref:Uncharacterized protein n=1 Tax=Trypanosoma rangeli TaxID=5698 RepID=A0A422NYN9_TRYRA|nr:uncharacterized protein TraAM80_01503 [Trypanosoma rangeli]RNF10576.1 hypothetical protein TraAM80_01503 [Trypanosoma rangeli]|eukprot:RNF10576.1 hypothetical protein TraAM80_01503 [Trypanosoma rangeli]
MGSKDVTSGFYGDVPYCSPVESSVFFDTITASRMHRLPEAMIARADLALFFTEGNTFFHNLIIGLEKEVNSKESCPEGGCGFEFLDIIPRLFHSPSALRLVRESEDGNCFVVIESKNISNMGGVFDGGKEDESSVYTVVSLDLRGIDCMWQSLLSYLLGGTSEKNMVYILPNINFHLQKGNSYGEFLVSLWALVVSSVLHYFASFAIDSIRQRLNKVTIRIGVLEGHECDNILDDVQLFFENKLRICVHRVLNTETLTNNPCIVDLACDTAAETYEEWIEKATELVVGIHEELCDTGEEEPSRGDTNLRCILFVVPEMELLRKDLQRHLCDSYTSTPIMVVSSEKEIHELLLSHSRSIPIVYFCSQKSLKKQLLKPEHERYLNHLSVEALLYGEKNRDGRDFALIRMLVPGSPSPKLLPYPIFVSTNADEGGDETSQLDDDCLQEAINITLWLFRRFKLETCRKGIQPVLSISEMTFISRGAAAVFEKVMNSMMMSGLVSFLKLSDESHLIRLEVLGRALSYRFRLPYRPKFPEFTLFDVKCIFWCYAFRQSRETALKLISDAHFFPIWVEDAMNNFCFQYRIRLENDIGTEREALVRELSLIPKFNEINSRVKNFLTHSSGERLPISRHFASAPSTSCRGWFEQAPLGTSAESIPKPHVNVYCYPSQNELCEIRFGGNTLQCPLDLSYPLIITHIVLHTTLWNNGIILESDRDTGLAAPLPIPLTVLNSPTLNSFLEDVVDGKAGFWLDNFMNSTPSLSDPLELASLMAKTSSLLGICDHKALRRKRNRVDLALKHQKNEAKEASLPLSETEAATIREFANAAIKLGREKTEKRFKGVKGFAFLDPSHKNYAYYLHILEQSNS